jgi:hypothetical protein
MPTVAGAVWVTVCVVVIVLAGAVDVVISVTVVG